jgi:hypothetical protein
MTVVHHTAADRIYDFIPIRKADLIETLVKARGSGNDAECEKFGAICRALAAINHCEYLARLERLRDDYDYLDPQVDRHVVVPDDARSERAYSDLLQSLDRVLRRANFVELPHREIADAHRRRNWLRVAVKAPLDHFRQIRFYRRGRHVEQSVVSEWFGLRRRKVETDVYDDVVLLVAMKSKTEISSPSDLRALERRKIRPGAVLLKCFRNIGLNEINALFPNIRVVMSDFDKLMLGVPAIVGGIPILLNLYATVGVLLLVIGFHLGMKVAVHDKDIRTAFAALSGLVALGTFGFRQWIRYQHQSLRYRTELTDTIYYRNINNNSGIFDYLIGEAEEQECKEAVLAYHFLQVAPEPLDVGDLQDRVEAWLREAFDVELKFKVATALLKLERLGLVRREGERLFVSPLDGALAQLNAVWNSLFSADTRRPDLTGAISAAPD